MLATSGDTFWTQWKSKKKSQGFLAEAFPDRSMFTGDPTRLESKTLLLLTLSSQKLLYSRMRRIVEVVIATPAGTDAANVQWMQLAGR